MKSRLGKIPEVAAASDRTKISPRNVVHIFNALGESKKLSHLSSKLILNPSTIYRACQLHHRKITDEIYGTFDPGVLLGRFSEVARKNISIASYSW